MRRLVTLWAPWGDVGRLQHLLPDLRRDRRLGLIVVEFLPRHVSDELLPCPHRLLGQRVELAIDLADEEAEFGKALLHAAHVGSRRAFRDRAGQRRRGRRRHTGGS
eukprot:gene21360-41390_t